MALGDPYASMTELKDRLEITGTELDARLTASVLAASGDIETYCGRQFNQTTVATQRKYPALSDQLVLVDDFHTTTDLAVSIVERQRGVAAVTTVMDMSFIEHGPYNADRHGYLGFPYWILENWSTTDFPCEGEGYVLVTAQWGWDAVPAPVKESCLILGEEYFKMKEAPFGVANWGEFGPERMQENRVVKKLLDRYARETVFLA